MDFQSCTAGSVIGEMPVSVFPRFLLRTFCPSECGKAPVNRCRIESIDVVAQIEDLGSSGLAGLVYQMVGMKRQATINTQKI